MSMAKTFQALTIAILAVLWCGTASAGVLVPEFDPGTAIGGIALLAVCAMLLLERYHRR